MELEERHQVTLKVTLVGALVNAGLSALQIIFGIFGQSQALLADGLHTLSDLSSDFIVLLASKLSSRAADDEHPYGHGRIETLASLLLGLILISVGISLAVRGSSSIFETEKPDPKIITVFFAVLAILCKEFLYRYTIRAARSNHSTLLESNALHHRSDALSSIVVVIGISSQLAGIPHMDAAAAIIVGLMIISMGVNLCRRSLNELIDSSLNPQQVELITEILENSGDIRAIHSLRTRSMGGLGYVDAELRVNPRLTVSEAHHIAYSLGEKIKSKASGIVDVSIHIDPMTETKHEELNHLPSRSELMTMLQSSWQEVTLGNHILQINLHYLEDGVELDIVLPAEFHDQNYNQETELLVQKATCLTEISQVNIYYKQDT
ncbi:MAG: cation transporter [Gammaproteobacteria bacterium]|nr:cation transporter [Gammaproteobacteria bacterium]